MLTYSLNKLSVLTELSIALKLTISFVTGVVILGACFASVVMWAEVLKGLTQ